METRKLFYEDCLMQEFSATVLSCQQTEKGWEVIMDATAFYPEGGGQGCDVGVLGGVNVLDVREKGEAIVHLCDAPLPEGKKVTGIIDWARRFDLMQQHTGEHILSGILHRLYGAQNTGFHVGADVVQVDFDVPVPAEMLASIEAEVNDAIYQNIPVKCWYPTQEELPHVFYRTKRALPWPVRIVQVPGYDSCACCGVHVAYTGQVGMVKILSCIKFHEGVRMEIVCGKRALDYFTAVYEQNKQVSNAFSAKVLETGAAARRMNDALAAEKFRSGTLERQVFDHVAAGYQEKGNVLHFAEGLMPAAVRELAERIANICGGVAAVFSGNDAEGYTVCLVSKQGPVAELGKEMAQTLFGRGGGKPGFYQGSVKAAKSEIEAFFGKTTQF